MGGFPTVSWSDGIAEGAARHAGQMARGDMPFSHDGFETRVKDIRNIPLAANSVGENLAFCKGFPDVAKCAVQGWINSPGHEENLRGKWTLCGIGTAMSEKDGSYYVTQLFASSPAPL